MRRLMFSSVVGFALLVGLPAPAPAQQGARAAVDIAPHRAVYVLSLGRTRQGANVSAARGALVMEWAKSCDGWTVKQRLQLDLTNNEGGTVSSDSNFSSFEALNGLSYRFTSRDTRGGQVVEDLQGKAALDRRGAKGTADFSRPEGRRFDLPKGTLFPTAHMVELIAAARRGEKIVYRTLFDGTTLDGPLAVNAVIGKATPKASGAQAREPLTNRPSWRIRMAFFPLNTSKAEPDYELGLTLFDNGVADAYEIDYESFSVNARLERIEALERPRC